MIRYLPNAVTIGRLILVFPTIYMLLEERWVIALTLFVVAGVSDALDGVLARRLNSQTELGEVLDPLADKLLVGALIVIFAIQGHFPVWLAAIVLGRDLVILLGAISYRLLLRELEITPLFLSKVATSAQLILLALILIDLARVPGLMLVSEWMVDPIGFGVILILAIASGTTYVVTWSRLAHRRWGKRASKIHDSENA